MSDEARIAAARARWHAAAHAMQSGVAFAPDKSDQSPKHLRTGINVALSDQAGLARLLIAKGVFTEAEYAEAIADEMERELKRHEADLAAKLRHPVRLA